MIFDLLYQKTSKQPVEGETPFNDTSTWAILTLGYTMTIMIITGRSRKNDLTGNEIILSNLGITQQTIWKSISKKRKN